MRRLKRNNSVDDLYDQMQNMMNQLQQNTLDLVRGVPVDIQEEDKHYKLTADLPGVQKEDIDLKADEETLQIAAETTQELEEHNEKYVRKERSQRTFQRNIVWPNKVQPETVEANYEEGVLTVTAEKQEDNSKDIEIN